jgi:GNAT superfamily N-acetyltransferase
MRSVALSKVIPAREEDTEKIFSLSKKLIEMHDPIHPIFGVKRNSAKLFKSDLKKIIAGPASTILKIENDEGKLLAFVILKILQKPQHFRFSRCGYIAETMVDEKYRRAGLGTKLVQASEKWFRKQNIKCVQMQVAVKNPKGIKFWTESGFEQTTLTMAKFI